MPRPGSPAALATTEIDFGDPGVALAVLGPKNDHLRVIERETVVAGGLRGTRLTIQGSGAAVALAERVVKELVEVVESGSMVGPTDVLRAIRTMQTSPDARLADLYGDVVLVTARRRSITPKSPAQKKYIEAMRTHDIVFGIGPAGTGKTYLAMAMAVAALQNREIKRIILTRPAVEAGEKLGFLPGDLVEKVNPYLRPLYDALHDMMDLDKAQALISRGQIEVAPLAFMRGRTLSDCYVILDEAQNTTSEQMKMFLTRLGSDSKAVITGDVTQVDLPTGRRSGLLEARDLLAEVEGIAFSTFTEVDVVRHPLVQAIIRAYESRGQSGPEKEEDEDA
jgi:phosphate starvation-inducible PhoH-like protein